MKNKLGKEIPKMKMNKRGQSELLIIVLVAGVLFGGLGGLKVAKLNPFSRTKAAGSIQKDEGRKSEYYRDKIKGVEYRNEETYKNQNNTNLAGSDTIGSKIGRFIDSSIRLIIFVLIGGLILFFVTGINIFKRFKQIGKEIYQYKKALKQTVKAVDVAKPKMNGEAKILKDLLAMKQDEDTKNLIAKLKNE